MFNNIHLWNLTSIYNFHWNLTRKTLLVKIYTNNFYHRIGTVSHKFYPESTLGIMNLFVTNFGANWIFIQTHKCINYLWENFTRDGFKCTFTITRTFMNLFVVFITFWYFKHFIHFSGWNAVLSTIFSLYNTTNDQWNNNNNVLCETVHLRMSFLKKNVLLAPTTPN